MAMSPGLSAGSRPEPPRAPTPHLFSSSSWLSSSTFSLSTTCSSQRSCSILASSSRTCWGKQRDVNGRFLSPSQTQEAADHGSGGPGAHQAHLPAQPHFRNVEG